MQKQLEQILNKVGGSAEDFGLEHRVFNCAIAICISSSIPGFFYMLIQGWVALSLLLTVNNLVYFYIYYLCRFANKLQLALMVFCLLIASMLNVFWIIDYGVKGSTGALLFVIIVIIVFTADKPKNYMIAIVVNLILMATFDEYIRSFVNFNIPYNEASQKAALTISVIYTVILLLLYKQLVNRRMDSTFYEVMDKLNKDSAAVEDTADKLANTSDQLLEFAMQQKTATEQLSVTTEELGATAEQNQHLTSSAMERIKGTNKTLEESKQRVETLVNSIDKIKNSGEEIKAINNLINEIAYQTNLLSLNAMIEASRAGEGNGGFKVVAMEVKKLAERSSDAVDKINILLDKNVKTIDDTVELAQAMNISFHEITESMSPVVDDIRNVTDASIEQHSAIRQITDGINDIDRAVDENKKLSDLSASTVAELRENARSLLEVVDTLQQHVHQQENQ